MENGKQRAIRRNSFGEACGNVTATSQSRSRASSSLDRENDDQTLLEGS